jgi:two-component system response regulator AtoC
MDGRQCAPIADLYPFRVLVVDDEPSLLRLLRGFLEQRSYQVDVTDRGQKALRLIRHNAYDLVLLDLKMPDQDGIATLQEIKKIGNSPPVMLMTAYGTVQHAVNAFKYGASDFISKPLSLEALDIQIQRLREHRSRQEKYLGRREPEDYFGAYDWQASKNKKMQDLNRLIAKVAPLPCTVLLQGESGTGKELIARKIHSMSPRSKRRLFAINCATIPVQLMESELFGYERGAFTGAENKKIGYFEAADNGTIFLDEISEMGLDLQVKLLRVLQEGTFKRVGGIDEIYSNVRIIASTNRNLDEEVAKNRFRKDLYYRINVIRMEAPPLRERREDIYDLAGYFLEKYSRSFGKNVTRIAAPVMELFRQYGWEGNIRELENAIARAVAVVDGFEIGIKDLPDRLVHSCKSTNEQAYSQPFRIAKSEFERSYLERIMAHAGGNIAHAARISGIPRQNLYTKLKKNGIDWLQFR